MPPKNLQLTVAWILLASLIMGVALWQAQVVVERESAGKHKNLPPPTNTRNAIRPDLTVAAVDPVADYIARCEKGMTIQEIRWVLTDFANAGLTIRRPKNDAPAAEVLGYRKKQGRWYLQCLTEGLNLTSEQAAEASGKMAKLFQEEYESRLDLLTKQGITDPKPMTDSARLLKELDQNWTKDLILDPFNNEISYRYQPWDLCPLTPSQARVTWKEWYDIAFPNRSSTDGIDAILNTPELSDPQKLSDKTGGPRFLLGSPLNTAITTGDAPDRLPVWLSATNRVHPILASQKLGHEGGTSQEPANPEPPVLLRLIRSLHPAQLMTALLLTEGLEKAIDDELVKSGN